MILVDYVRCGRGGIWNLQFQYTLWILFFSATADRKLSRKVFESTETVSQTVSSPLPPTKYAFLRTLFCIGGRGGIRTLHVQYPLSIFCFPSVTKYLATASNPQTVPMHCLLPCSLRSLRKRRDSNPRSGLPDAGFRNRCTKPLCDSSCCWSKRTISL